MSEEPIERKLAELFETRLQDFFAKSIPEKLEEAAKHFERIEIGHRLNGQFFGSSALLVQKVDFSRIPVRWQFAFNFCASKRILACFMIRRRHGREANRILPVHTFVVSETSTD